MSSNLKTFTLAALWVSASFVCSAASGQSPLPGYARLYEQGVNAYFAGGACRADDLLSEALTFNSEDPRAYYFRALSLLRQGRLDEAQGDMVVGAALEAQHPQRFAVGTALERVQGPDRLLLEKFRCQARRDAAELATTSVATPPAAAHQAPPANTFITPQERAAGVLREKRVVPLEELLRPTGPQTVADEPAAAPAPPHSAAPAVPPQTPPAEQPAQTPDNPFGDDTEQPAAPAPAPQTPPQEAPQPTPPAAPPAENDENPFGG